MSSLHADIGKADLSATRFAAWIFGLALIHIALALYAFPPSVVFDDRPLAPTDYQTHYRQFIRVSESVDTFGKTWAYDPHMAAGSPVGLIFDVDNKFHFLFSYTLNNFGIPRPIAFDLFPVFVFLMAPISILVATTLLQLGRRATIASVSLTILVWNFDSAFRFIWSAGMISFAFSACLSIVVIALYYRFIEGNSSLFFWLLVLLLPLSLLSHVWGFAILVGPLAVLYLRRFRRLRRLRHFQVGILVAVSIALNSYWLFPAIAHYKLLSPSGLAGQLRPIHFLTAWLEIFTSPITTGFLPPKTMFRYIALFLSVLAIRKMYTLDTKKSFFMAFTMAYLFLLTYFSSLLPVLREIEPFRFIIPMSLISIILGGYWISGNVRWDAIVKSTTTAKYSFLALLFILLPHMSKQILFYFPNIGFTQVQRVHLPSFILRPYRLCSVSNSEMQLAQYINNHCRDDGRLLVSHFVIGEFLGWSTNMPIIGGFPDKRMIFEDANIFRRITDKRFLGDELQKYLIRYNIRYIVMLGPNPIIELRRNLFTLQKIIGQYRIYRISHPSSYFLKGSGIVTASLNRITIRNATPDPQTQSIVLKFHYIEDLACSPNCHLERVNIPYSRASFIRIKGSPTIGKEIVIQNQY